MYFGDSFFFEELCESCCFAVSVVVEAAVAVDFWIVTFSDNVVEALGVQVVGEFCSVASFDAVGGPEDLLESIELD